MYPFLGGLKQKPKRRTTIMLEGPRFLPGVLVCARLNETFGNLGTSAADRREQRRFVTSSKQQADVKQINWSV